jgi:hypothetical protein
MDPLSPVQSCMANQAEANRSDRRHQEPARDSLQHQGRENQRKARLKCNNDRTDRHHCGARHDERSLRTDGIHQFASRELTEQAGETARGQDEADIFLRPSLVSQVSGHIGTEASQNTEDHNSSFGSRPARRSRQVSRLAARRFAKASPAENCRCA